MSNIEVFSVDYDKVIKSAFVNAVTTYQFSIEKLVPLIDQLDIQRKIQNPKFYQRLERDMLGGCIIPPLTLAFIRKDDLSNMGIQAVANYIEENINEGFVLDGIQRLNTLKLAEKEYPQKLDVKRRIFLNILICESMDSLLYRMITLNNGQKPMTARHQIEILASNIYDFSDKGIIIQTERERGKRIIKGSFDKAEFISGYLAFLSNSINIDNQKIIEEKMNELIADKILESNPLDRNVEFSQILNIIERFVSNKELRLWFKVNNNFIGFCVGIRKSYNVIMNESIESFLRSIKIFEKTFSSFDASKLKLGSFRRKLSKYFIENYDKLSDKDEVDLMDVLSQID